jgi:hypothetical protein
MISEMIAFQKEIFQESYFGKTHSRKAHIPGDDIFQQPAILMFIAVRK